MSLNYYYTGRSDKAVEMITQVAKIDPDNQMAKEVLQIVATDRITHSVENYVGKWWSGEDLSGKSLYVFCDQGMGDTLNLIRYLIDIKDRHFSPIIDGKMPVGCCVTLSHYAFTKEMSELMGHVSRNFNWIDEFESCPFYSDNFDYCTNIMSLPCLVGGLKRKVYYPAYWLEVMEKTKIPEQPLLTARNPVPLEGQFKVGIAWQSNADNPLSRKKSATLEQFLSFADGTNELYSVIPSEERSEKVVFFSLPDLMATCNLIASLDVVVTVDTVTLHLAGMMGKKTLALLPFQADPRWGKDNFTVWYSSVELFRQVTPGDWTFPLNEAKKRLEVLRKKP